MPSFTRRNLIAGLACTGLAATSRAELLGASQTSRSQTSAFVDIVRAPDDVTVFCGLNQATKLSRFGTNWTSSNILVTTIPQLDCLPVCITAERVHPTHLHLRWNVPIHAGILILNDAWERSYGNLHWESLVPERVLPWYFFVSDEEMLHGYGVRTGAAALCFWQIDPEGISLWMNICNGGSGVALDSRELLAATVVARRGQRGENPLDAARWFCRSMCKSPRPVTRIYGSNDWYYAYGQNTARQIVRDAELMASLSPGRSPRPFTVIDEGWDNKQTFPDMEALAFKIRSYNVRPGLWIRPLQADTDTPVGLLLPETRFGSHRSRKSDLAFDPTIPEALERVLAKVTQAVGWGYELIKHDFSTYDLLGHWGFEMHAQPTLPGWSFHDRSLTNAEIISNFYRSMRQSAGSNTLLVGCNTIGHLGAGFFDAQRTGDDVSGNIWERTRRMGINTLAFRLPQHRSFFALDPDVVPITTKTPWSCNRQWLDLVARSGTVLLVSPQPAAMGREQLEAVSTAFELSLGEAETIQSNWQDNTTPDHWEFRGAIEKSYNWCQDTGAWPFPV